MDEAEGRLRRLASAVELSILSFIVDGNEVSEEAGIGVEAVEIGSDELGMISVSNIASGEEVGSRGLVNSGARRGGDTMADDL